MSQKVEFAYFADAQHFTHLAESSAVCHFCREERPCLDGGTFYGDEEIAAICPACLQQGKLETLDIEVNDIDASKLAGTPEEVAAIYREITYRTPQIPTWQEFIWPVRDGKAYRFVKIASKPDYIEDKTEEEGKRLFVASLHDNDQDVDWLWSMLPEEPIRSVEEGQFDLAFYLFESEGVRLTTWDAN